MENYNMNCLYWLYLLLLLLLQISAGNAQTERMAHMDITINFQPERFSHLEAKHVPEIVHTLKFTCTITDDGNNVRSKEEYIYPLLVYSLPGSLQVVLDQNKGSEDNLLSGPMGAKGQKRRLSRNERDNYHCYVAMEIQFEVSKRDQINFEEVFESDIDTYYEFNQEFLFFKMKFSTRKRPTPSTIVQQLNKHFSTSGHITRRQYNGQIYVSHSCDTEENAKDANKQDNILFVESVTNNWSRN